MADKKATLLIQLKDGATAGLKKLQTGIGGVESSFSKFKMGLAGVATGLAAVIAASWSAVKAYMESETAVSRLNIALRNQGQDVSKVSKELTAYAAELQKTTTFTDEAIVGAMSLMTSFGLSGETLKRTTKAAMDLSQGLGIDLHTASMLLSKAYQGNTEALSRYGIKVDESIPKALKFEAIMAQLNSRFGGASEAALNTTAGRITNLTNRIDELKERVGAQLLPVLDFWMRKMETLISYVERLGGAEKAEASGRQLTIQSLQEQSAEIIKQARLRAAARGDVVMMTAAEMERLDLITRSLQREREMIASEEATTAAAKRGSADRVAAKQGEIAALDALALEERNKAVATQVQGEFDAQARYAAEAAAFREQIVGKSRMTAEHESSMTKLSKMSADERIRTASAMFSAISSLSQSKNKQLAAVGKAGAIATAMVNTYQGISEAWKLGPILGPILAPLVAAAGFANVAKIQSVQMAEGGVVMPRSGGTLATIGEAGRPEAVIPLGDDKAQEAMGGLGTTNHVTINAGVFVGDKTAVKELARLMDEELFRLQRNRVSVQ